MKILDEPKAIRLKIMDFLSRREHSSKEIYQKLLPRNNMIDDEGNVTLSEEQLFVMKSKHFFNQIKSKEPVKISLATYASLSGEVPDALSDFETKIKILFL